MALPILYWDWGLFRATTQGADVFIVGAFDQSALEENYRYYRR